MVARDFNSVEAIALTTSILGICGVGIYSRLRLKSKYQYQKRARGEKGLTLITGQYAKSYGMN